MSDEKKYYVYMHLNKINNKKYIGITCQKKPEYRWGRNGSKYKGSVFYQAIEKYGWDNFEHIILYNDLSKEQACRKEQELIFKYNTRDKSFGYNLSIGGEHGSTGYINNKMSIPVYQYDLDGKYMFEYPSLSEAERVTGISNSEISACCKGKLKHAGKYQWSYNKVDFMEAIDIKELQSRHRKDKGKSVFKYSLDGNFLCEYSNVNVASDDTTIPISGIYKACKTGKTSGGYRWFYEYQGNKIEPIGIYDNLYHSVTSVNIYDKKMNFIKHYDSIMAAQNDLHIKSASNIYMCLHGERKTCYGYIWKYVEE